MLDVIVSGMSERRLRDDLPPVLLLAASLLLGIMPQIARRLVSATRPPANVRLPSPDEVADGMVDILFRGIAARSATSPAQE